MSPSSVQFRSLSTVSLNIVSSEVCTYSYSNLLFPDFSSTSVLLLKKMKRGIANSSGCQLFPTFRCEKYQRYLKVSWLSDRGTRGCVRNRNISEYKCWNSISTVYAIPDAHSGSVTLQHSSEAMGLCIFI